MGQREVSRAEIGLPGLHRCPPTVCPVFTEDKLKHAPPLRRRLLYELLVVRVVPKPGRGPNVLSSRLASEVLQLRGKHALVAEIVGVRSHRGC